MDIKDSKRMIIIKKSISNIHVHGRVKVQVFHPEDIERREPTFTDEGDNDVNSWILGQIKDHLKSSSGSTNYHLQYNLSSASSSAGVGDAGIAVDTNVNLESSGQGYNQHLMLYTKESGDYHVEVPASPGNRIDFVGQALYPSGASNASSVTDFKLGRSWREESGGGEEFTNPYASYSATAFALSPGDLVRAEWSITIG